MRVDTLQGVGGDAEVKSIKTDSDEPKKGRQLYRRKINRGDTAEVATKKRSPGFLGKK